ncbi:MAG: response regulator [Rhodospirillales bacterium]|nr:response regulator [Rhodospirillales bacterium]MDE2319941.1 response regulator [Rhodospirillales bacterium]
MTSVHFLLVDDLEENLLSLEALLRRDGLELLKARSGDEALELLLHHEVALALVDVQMPGLNGFELAELMRGNERTRRIPLIFLTAGAADAQRRFRGYEAGAVDFIYKPIEADILRSKADVFFELHRQRQQLATQRDALEVQAQALRQADRRKDEFLATLAHELRNPLAPLRHGLDLLQHSREGSKATEILDIMDRQLTHLVRLIDDLLDVSRISQGKIVLRKERLELFNLIRAALETSRPLIEAANHELTLELPEATLWLEADLTRLAQVISNLLNNAVKYTPEGGHIRLVVKADGQEAVISVADNGVGIPPHMLASVFELFAQVDQHLDRAKGGLGIGLALVQQLVALHGGTVVVESEGCGKGSIFTLTVPLATGSAPSSSPSPSAIAGPPAAMARLKVLVVDDTQDVAQTTGWMLEELGHEYRLVHDGRKVLETTHAFQPDVILLDIGLPGMSGYEVCLALRQDPALKHLTIIAQTGWGQDRDKASAQAAGFDHYLVKPVGLRALGALMAELAAAKAAKPATPAT